MLTAMPFFRSLARIGLPLALAASLSACATPFQADVSRFAVPLPAPQGQTFAVVPEDPKLAGGLEFATYANAVAEEMQQLGYARAASPETADMLVRFDYRIDNGRERVRTDPGVGFAGGPWGPWGPWGGGFGRWGFGFNDPWLAGPNVRSYTVYTSGIELKIDRTADGQRLFEGKAEAVSRSNRLPRLVPNLVDAIFTDFPGHSGETLRITIRDDEKTVREAN
ncbi:DUF4136 domain-containing protein [Erythrobacter sp. sf7]|uniref:DUF4136 domain-containing protein n=1 Tax=Erythrobacter fulvus TaxID=2987523 RepID=A0ABT5JSB4_9SPHN|nr:DUF4136 domain-containing protein [Erythrobacter fulvus]MDC8755663.1 DUF4136 domain-containing protein [Erythrobacter fulvus]